MAGTNTRTLKRSTLMFLAAGLFLLAGLIEFAVGASAKPVFLSIGAMFLALGALWLILGAKARRDEARAENRPKN